MFGWRMLVMSIRLIIAGGVVPESKWKRLPFSQENKIGI